MLAGKLEDKEKKEGLTLLNFETEFELKIAFSINFKITKNKPFFVKNGPFY